ncbi:OmpA family protein [Nocardiopsis suaedae]|uniref:OmpA family protein n=1 Tax=Nocardiopsis suaedae TaxID=3018444 RepID=A0ABT4TS42_9ACTN|nr:OmpA family protein [Nocardiopsis suaedae]MDA2807170.1 OmpA family protein [Nocardiopsis suaedae]
MARRIVLQTGALLFSIAVLAGVPYVATTVLGWPRLDWDADSAMAYLRGGSLPPGVATAFGVGLLWVLWGLYLAAAATELWQRMRDRPARRLFGPLQLLAATAVGATATTPVAHAVVEPAATADADEGEVPVEEGAPPPAPEGGAHEEAGPEGRVHIERSRVLSGIALDSAELTPEMEADLAPVIAMIRDHGAAGVPIVVTGHTDASGDPEYNQQLSQRRAESVAEHLTAELGPDAPEVVVQGVGADELLEDATDSGQRRVEITYTVASGPPPAARTPESPAPEQPPEQAPDERPVVVVEIPSAATAAGAAAASGVVAGATGYLLGRRPRPDRDRGPGEGDEDDWDESEDEALAGAAQDPAHASTSLWSPPPPVEADSPTPQQQGETFPLRRLRGALGITGVGAHGAVRTVLAMALQREGLRVVLREDCLVTLLGDVAAERVRDGAPPGIRITTTLSEAIAHLHAEMLTNLEEDEDDDQEPVEPPNREADDEGEVSVLIAAADREEAQQVDDLLDAGGAPVAALVLSRWSGRVAVIDHAGHVHKGDGDIGGLAGTAWPLTTRGQVIDALIDAQRNRSMDSGSENGSDDGQVAAGTQDEGPEAEAPERPVRLRVLGRVGLTVGGKAAVPRRRSAYEVAAYLALHPDGVRLERAVEDMWPEDIATRSTRRFHDAVSALRGAVRQTASARGTATVVLHDDHYRLDPEAVSTDLWDLHKAMGPDGTADDLLQATVDYEDFAADSDFRWAELHRERLRQRLIEALLAAADDSEPNTAVRLLRRAVQVAPLTEQPHRKLVTCLLEQGDTGAAATAFAAYELAMREVGAEVAPELRAQLS